MSSLGGLRARHRMQVDLLFAHPLQHMDVPPAGGVRVNVGADRMPLRSVVHPHEQAQMAVARCIADHVRVPLEPMDRVKLLQSHQITVGCQLGAHVSLRIIDAPRTVLVGVRGQNPVHKGPVAGVDEARHIKRRARAGERAAVLAWCGRKVAPPIGPVFVEALYGPPAHQERVPLPANMLQDGPYEHSRIAQDEIDQFQGQRLHPVCAGCVSFGFLLSDLINDDQNAPDKPETDIVCPASALVPLSA